MSPIRSSVARPRARAARLAFLAAFALMLAACGMVSTTPPSPTPADFPGIAGEMTKRGLVVDDVIAGDAGCDDHVLTPTAISFRASGFDQTTPVQIYLYVFRNRATFDRLGSSVDNCARSYVTDPAGYVSLSQSPYVVASQGPWGATFEAKVREALTVAAGTGN